METNRFLPSVWKVFFLVIGCEDYISKEVSDGLVDETNVTPVMILSKVIDHNHHHFLLMTRGNYPVIDLSYTYVC